MASNQLVRTEIRDYIATVTLDRPPVNALSMDLYRAIANAFRELDRRGTDVRVAILTGASKCFCGGRDIKQADTDPPEERSATVKDCFGALYHCEVPVIAAVNGPAMGAGFALAALCDVIIASEKAVFAIPEIDAGVNPGVAAFRRGFTEYQARKLAFTGERISPQELYRLGVADQVVAPDDLLPSARKLAAVMAAKSPLIMRKAKWSANETEKMVDFEQAYRAIESRVTVSLFNTQDSHEAGRSVIQKRAPKFKGA